MMSERLDGIVPEMVKRRAEQLGEPGRLWLASLPGRLAMLADAWAFTPGEVLVGGSEALVMRVDRASGEEAILKIPLWLSKGRHPELEVLLIADGVGYARVHAFEDDAWLVEALGVALEVLERDPERLLTETATALQRAWHPIDQSSASSFFDQREKAKGLARMIAVNRDELELFCSATAIDLALDYASARADAFDPHSEPSRLILGHGDPHPGNLLAVPGADPPTFKFVDPDGLWIERAYDLGVMMREWSVDELGGAPVETAAAWCVMLGELVGEDPGAIWQWAYIERMTTALVLEQLGMPEERARLLEVTKAWCEVPDPFA